MFLWWCHPLLRSASAPAHRATKGEKAPLPRPMREMFGFELHYTSPHVFLLQKFPGTTKKKKKKNFVMVFRSTVRALVVASFPFKELLLTTDQVMRSFPWKYVIIETDECLQLKLTLQEILFVLFFLGATCMHFFSTDVCVSLGCWKCCEESFG